jgi:protein phosphatase 4 regulatory subunit 3
VYASKLLYIHLIHATLDDPEFPRLKANYRDFLAENAKHHQVVEFRDPGIRAKVHHTYRLQSLKDVVLARALDDVIFNSISSTIIFNQIEIVTYIQNEEYFLREVFSIFVQHPNGPTGSSTEVPSSTTTDSTPTLAIDGPEPSTTLVPQSTAAAHGMETRRGQVEKVQIYTEDRRAPALLLLHQFCTMGKNGQVPFRLALFRSLVDRGVLYPVQWALGQSDIRVLNTAAEILAMVLDHDAGGVRGHILRQVEEDARREGGESAAGTNGAEGSVPVNGTVPPAPLPSMTGYPHPPTLLAMMSSILTSTQHELSLKSQLADSFKTLMDVPGLDATVRASMYPFGYCETNALSSGPRHEANPAYDPQRRATI